MYVRRILEQVGDRALVEINVAGAQLIAGINKNLPEPVLSDTATGFETLAAFDKLNPADQARIEGIVEDYMLSNFGVPPTAAVPVATVSTTRDYRAFISVMFSIALVAMSVAYLALVIYVSFRNLAMPEWTDTFIPFVTLAAVVWNYNGLLTKENRDAIAAGLGSVPGGFLATIAQAIAAGRKRGGPNPP